MYRDTWDADGISGSAKSSEDSSVLMLGHLLDKKSAHTTKP